MAFHIIKLWCAFYLLEDCLGKFQNNFKIKSAKPSYVEHFHDRNIWMCWIWFINVKLIAFTGGIDKMFTRDMHIRWQYRIECTFNILWYRFWKKKHGNTPYRSSVGCFTWLHSLTKNSAYLFWFDCVWYCVFIRPRYIECLWNIVYDISNAQYYVPDKQNPEYSWRNRSRDRSPVSTVNNNWGWDTFVTPPVCQALSSRTILHGFHLSRRMQM